MKKKGNLMLKASLLLLLTLSFSHCSKKGEVNPQSSSEQSLIHRPAMALAASEDFETGSKSSYSAASVTLGTGSWYLDDALIGGTSSDVYNGSYAARVRNTGKMTMQFNLSNGIGTVSIQHAIYGSDGSSTWELYYSTNSGSSWTKSGATVTTASGSFATANFTINQTGTVRLEIRKITGGSYRINFDDIVINDYSGGGTSTTSTTSSTGGVTSGGCTSTNLHLTMGNPSCAVTNSSTYADNYLMVKTQYVLSYSNTRRIPNWVAWHLDASDLGSAGRSSSFSTDGTLPSGWYQVTSSDYTGSGFDRGHHCPSGDRTASSTDNLATFLTTNIMPQAPDNNQGPWEQLETYCRTLVNNGNELYIVCGGAGQGGSGSNGSASTIASGKIVVPAYTWKVIVILSNGTNDLSRVTSSTRVIAVKLPNTQGIRSNTWGSYRVKVDDVETLCGYDLLSSLSTSLQSSLESTVDTGPTN